MLKRVSFILVYFIGFCIDVKAQQEAPNPNEYQEYKPVLMRNQVTYGLTAHTAGFGIDVRRGKHITGYKLRVLDFEFVSMRHPKEIRSVNPYFENAKSYVYGKLNQVFVLRSGVGEQRTLFSKAERGNFQICMNYNFGFSLAFAKPVYLEILNDSTDYPFDYFIDRYDPNKYYIDQIMGRASFFEGIGHTKIYPGIYTKLGFNFDWSSRDEGVKALEVGIIGDVYYKSIPMMAYNTNHPYYVNFYLTFLFGRKW